jgi:hypothetical protein
MAELQKALSDSHLAIYDEKNTVNSLRLEYEDLLKLERADQKRIKELESLNDDIENRASNKAGFKDCRPLSAQKTMPLSRKEREIMKASKVPNKNGKSVMSNRSGESNKSDIQVNQTTGGIVKTVLLPFDQINNLKNELEHLK